MRSLGSFSQKKNLRSSRFSAVSICSSGNLGEKKLRSHFSVKLLQTITNETTTVSLYFPKVPKQRQTALQSCRTSPVHHGRKTPHKGTELRVQKSITMNTHTVYPIFTMVLLDSYRCYFIICVLL